MNKKLLLGVLILAIGFTILNYLNRIKNDNTKYPPFPSQYLDDRKKYTDVKQLFNDAMDLTKLPDNSGKPFDMPKDKETQILSKLEEGVNLSKEIDDAFLDYLNPDLKNHYRNEYVRGNELILEGLKGNTSNENSMGVKEQLEGSQLIDAWNKWWDSNKDAITNKAFAK